MEKKNTMSGDIMREVVIMTSILFTVFSIYCDRL